MTGFGNGEVLIDDLLYRVEISSVNRKQADIIINMPRELSALETRVRKMIKESVSRGRVNVNIFVNVLFQHGLLSFSISYSIKK